jgi:transcriptional regulator with XRE-family HTH domain
VPARKGDQTKVRTKLGALRADSGLTQARMARYVGISLETYRRLERGTMAAPPISYLANCALVIEVELEDLVDDAWRRWRVFDRVDAPKPPHLDRGRQRREGA